MLRVCTCERLGSGFQLNLGDLEILCTKFERSEDQLSATMFELTKTLCYNYDIHNLTCIRGGLEAYTDGTKQIAWSSV